MIKLTTENTAGAITRAFQRAAQGLANKVTPVNENAYAVHSRVSGNYYACELDIKAGQLHAECSCPARVVCSHIVSVVAVHQGLLSIRERSRINHTHTALSALARNAGAEIPTYTDEKPVVKAPTRKADGPLVLVQSIDKATVRIGGVRWHI